MYADYTAQEVINELSANADFARLSEAQQLAALSAGVQEVCALFNDAGSDAYAADTLTNATSLSMGPSATLFVSPAFVGLGAPFYTTLSAANAAAVQGDTIVIYKGTYAGAITVLVDDLKMEGEAPAEFDSGAGAFSHGVLITGAFSGGGKKRFSLRNVAVAKTDVAGDVFICGPETSGVELHQEIDNCRFIGSAFNNGYHALHAGAGSHVRVRNTKCYRSSHGLAVKCKYFAGQNLYFEDAGAISTIIVKSDAFVSDVEHVTIMGVQVRSSAANRSGPIMVESGDAAKATRYVLISGVDGDDQNANGVYVIQTAGTLQYVQFVDVQVRSAFGDSFKVVSGSDVTFVACRSISAGGYGFNNAGGSRVQLIGCGSSGDTSGPTAGSFLIRQVNGLISFGRLSKSVAGGADVTLTQAEYEANIQEFTGLLTGNINVIVPLIDGTPWTIFNNTTGAFTLTVKGATGTGIAVGQGKRAMLYADGTNIVRASADV